MTRLVSLPLCAVALMVFGCDETNQECLEAPDPEGALPTNLEGASWGRTFCARYSGGGLRCWGNNRDGQIGPFPEYSDVVHTPTVVKEVACVDVVGCGASATCAVLEYGSVHCWGSDSFGEIGNGVASARAGIPESVRGIYDAASVAGYGVGMSARRRTGEVLAWGLITATKSDRPLRVAEIDTDSLSYGLFPGGGCAVGSDEVLRCWGRPIDDPAAQSEPLHVVENFTRAVEIGMEVEHACAMSPQGGLWCWGKNLNGELGDGTTTDRSSPTAVPMLGAVVQVSLGGNHTCARLADQSVWCWGNNFAGAVGPNGAAIQRTPVMVPLPAGIVDIATTSMTTCALDESGAIWCWGRNIDGELGTGESIEDSHEPHQVAW